MSSWLQAVQFVKRTPNKIALVTMPDFSTDPNKDYTVAVAVPSLSVINDTFGSKLSADT